MSRTEHPVLRNQWLRQYWWLLLSLSVSLSLSLHPTFFYLPYRFSKTSLESNRYPSLNAYSVASRPSPVAVPRFGFRMSACFNRHMAVARRGPSPKYIAFHFRSFLFFFFFLPFSLGDCCLVPTKNKLYMLVYAVGFVSLVG
jgi:hypothetical protein